MLRFEWDETKNQENLRKHRVRFEEAETVFYDERGVLIRDEDAPREERLVLIGAERRPARARGVPHLPDKEPGDSSDLGAEGE